MDSARRSRRSLASSCSEACAIAGRGCIGEGTLAHFANGRLDAARADAVRTHLSSCADCQALLDLVSVDARYAMTELKKVGTVVAHGGGAATPIPTSPAGIGSRDRTQRPSSSHDAVVQRALTGDGTGPTSIGVQVGNIIDGKYLVERILGEGGMGLVLQATHLQLRQPVALKFMHLEAMQNPEAAARFNREARAAVKLTGQHVCRVLDMGEAETGEPYIVFEYLDGQDLGEMLADRGKISVVEAVSYLLQACDAMAEAHSHGIVHRDLKPGNLFVTRGRDGALCLKVLDFGISKYVGSETDAVKTTTRSLMGSPLYMAPEQLISAKDVDARADIWALGAVLYQLLSGKTPFVGETLPTVIAQVMHATAAPLGEVVEGIPPGLCRVVDRCLSRDRESRYENVAELAKALIPFAPGAAFMAARTEAVLRGARPSQAVSAQTRKRPIALLAGAAVALAIAVVVLAIGLGGDKDSSRDARTAPAPATAVDTQRSAAPSEAVDDDTAPDPEAETESGAAGATSSTGGVSSADSETEIEIEMPVDDIEPESEDAAGIGRRADKSDRASKRSDKKSRRTDSKRRSSDKTSASAAKSTASAAKSTASAAKSTASAAKKTTRPPPLMDPTDDATTKRNKPVGDGVMDPD